jgi:predicted AAA+ superfamily ATPase
MPHQRNRLIFPAVEKKLKLWPVVGLLGIRQGGKSTFLRELLSQKFDLEYVTMDSQTSRKRAESAPESFVENPEKLLVIDEVQKVPDLFDAIKSQVDKKKRPGKYLLSGSVAFSEKIGIRESLTGRIGLCHLYPFSLSEIHNKSLGLYWGQKKQVHSQLTLSEFQKKLNNGGMPGFFHLHSADEYSQVSLQWIETTCFRDLAKVLRKNFDPELALRIYSELGKTENGFALEVANSLKKDTRIVSKYLDGFCEIFALLKLNPSPLGTGKAKYLYPDSGIATTLQSSNQFILESHILIEALSHFEAIGKGLPLLSYYKSEKKSYVPFIFNWVGKKESLLVQVSDSESPDRGEIASVESYLKRFNPTNKPDKDNIRQIFLYQGLESYFDKKKEFQPLRG